MTSPPWKFFRTEFLLPDKGPRGIVATEVVSRASALPALVGWISHSMRQEFGDTSFSRLMVPGLADRKRIEELINGARSPDADVLASGTLRTVRDAGVRGHEFQLLAVQQGRGSGLSMMLQANSKNPSQGRTPGRRED